jgi:hypothetical protein
VKLLFDGEALASIDQLKDRLARDARWRTRSLALNADGDLRFGDVYPALIATARYPWRQVQLGVQDTGERN